MKKGFTLIELLAVIVILAIIALIATPIVLNIIEDSKESAVLRSAEFYIDGVEHSIATAILKNKTIVDGQYSIMEDGNICIGKLEDSLCKKDESIQGSGYILEVNVKGEKPKEGTIIISSGEVSDTQLIISNKEIWTDPTTGNLVYKLAPGLYDKNDKLIMSWDELNEHTKASTALDANADFNTLIEGTGYTVEDIIGHMEGYKLVIAESVTSIGSSAFENSSLKEIIISSSVTSIEEWAFAYSGLTSIIISESVTSIGTDAFHGCASLTTIKVDYNNSVYDSRNNSNAIIETATNKLIRGCNSTIIPDSVTTIAGAAFAGSGITSITIPSSVTSIGAYDFYYTSSLTTIKVDSNNPVYDSRNNSNAIIETATNTLLVGCNSTIIPDSVTTIADVAFAGSGITSITIPSSVTSIGIDAFYGCTSLTTIYYKENEAGTEWIPAGVTVISDF